MAFPTTLEDMSTSNDKVDGTSVVVAADIDVLNVIIDSIQAKIGIDGSAVETSHDFMLKNATIQTVNVQDGASTSGTTAIPQDDTIPQNTEGDEYMTLAITPVNSNSKLKIEVVANFSVGGTWNA